MSRLARRAARRPEPTAEQKAAFEYHKALEAAGGVRWVTGDLSKRRIYFNDVSIGDANNSKITVYYDCNAEKWQTGKYVDDAVAALRVRIGL